MNPARTSVPAVPGPLALRSCSAFVSDAFHVRFARVPVLVHFLFSLCAPASQFVQSTCGVAVVDGEEHAPERPKRLSLNVGQDRLAASKWMPCGIWREVRRGGHLA